MLPTVSRADEVSDLRAQVKSMRAASAAMEKRLNRLEQERTRKIAVSAGPVPVAVPAGPPPIAVSGPLPSGLVIPEVTYETVTIPGTTMQFKSPVASPLTFAGITVWGVVDVAAAAQSAGTPYSSVYWGLNLLPVTAIVQNKPQYALIPGPTAVSSIGIKIDEPLMGGFRAIGALDTGFNPLTGELDDACKSLQSANGQPINSFTFGDASRCGQFINGNAWGGLTHPTYGTLTFGRQNPLGSIILFDYDPLAGAGLGMIGWLPSLAGSQGVSEAGKWDNSVKYRFDYGTLFHAQVMYSEGSAGTAIYGHGIGGNIGGSWNGFSVDAQYQQTVDGINNPNVFTTCGTATTPSCSTLDGQAVNTTGMGIEAKYVYLFGADPADKAPHDKLTFYGGFEQITYNDPSFPLSAGIATVGGYVEGAINNTPYLYGARIRQLSWGGVRYDTGPWSLELAYYHLNQPFRKTSPTSVFCNDASASNCAAASDDIAFMAYYALNKYVDVYSGVAWNGFSGGLANGEPVTQAVTGITGARLKF
jgi:predicted porin